MSAQGAYLPHQIGMEANALFLLVALMGLKDSLHKLRKVSSLFVYPAVLLYAHLSITTMSHFLLLVAASLL